MFSLCHPKITSFFPLNSSHEISNQMGLVYVIGDLSFLGLSPIPLEVVLSHSLASLLVSGSAKLSIDLTKSIAITPCLSNCLNKLCLRRMCLDLPLQVLLFTMLITDFEPLWREIAGTGLFHKEISVKRFFIHSTSSPTNVIPKISESIVDWDIRICFLDFQEMAAFANVNT